MWKSTGITKKWGGSGGSKKIYMFTSRSISTKRQFWVGDPPPSEGNGEEIPKIDNASRFLHMRGPFVPNFIKIGQLVQKDTFGWGTLPPPSEGNGEEIPKNRLCQSIHTYERTICAKCYQNRSISSKRHFWVGDIPPLPRGEWGGSSKNR